MVEPRTLAPRRPVTLFVDYPHNNRGNTSIAAFSTRARPGAPVSVPIRWSELDTSLRSDAWNLRTLPRRLMKLRAELWAGYSDVRQKLPS